MTFRKGVRTFNILSVYGTSMWSLKQLIATSKKDQVYYTTYKTQV